MQDNKLKKLLEEWQIYEHHGYYDESIKIANQIKKHYNIDMENENECEAILYKYHLIKGWEKYAE
jgi:hypothetical protein